MLEKFPKEVKIVTKHFPLPNHKFAQPASIAALAADRQGKYWEYHEEIFKDYSGLSDKKLEEIALKLGLDMAKFKQDLADPAIASLVNRDLTDGRKAGVRGTPTIFVNGKQLKNRSQAGFEQQIRSELAK